ncbi:hypothetical protein MVEN_02505400 [Mycena venus]|uniref:F-box domain-containing protein n=1 Tax=Mycena venus TaxID=2733690 RepID=A0A8H6U4D8_9AGAR|nr:hypothetical protein MVEN_02505400 [Mycena venus]
MTPPPLPLLETLKIRSLNGRTFSGPRIIEILRLAANLVQCIFDDVDPVSYIDHTAEKLVLPRLRRLMFGPDAYPDSNDNILNSLSLPTLEALSVSFLNLTIDDLISLLVRSMPPLQVLILGEGLESFDLYRCLTLVPTITRFEIWWSDSNIFRDLFATLADSPSLSPNLRSLTIYMTVHNLQGPDISYSSWETLIRALSARRTRLQVVRVVLDGSPPPQKTPRCIEGTGG